MSDLLTRDEIAQYLALLDKLPEDSPEVEKINQLFQADKRERCRQGFMPFVRQMWSAFIPGKHHQIMAEAFERVARGELKRLIINMPPRHTKSEFASYLLPAWFLGKFPERKVIQTSHTAELAVGFGRKVRNLVDSDVYKAIFPNVGLQADSKAAGRWATNKGGDYFAIGIGGAVTGKGADILIIDDPHSEQEAALSETNPEVYDKTYEWYTSGPRQRLQPGGTIVIVMTRWAESDLTGRVLADAMKRSTGEDWDVIELPAILPSGKPLWPEFWSLAELEALKAAALLHDAVEDNGRQAVIMEFVDGKSLRETLDKQGTLSLKLTVHIGLSVCAALEAAHRAGIIHRWAVLDFVLGHVVTSDVRLAGRGIDEKAQEHDRF